MARTVSFFVFLGLALLAFSPASAQSSASFEIRDDAFNAGGHPVNGADVGSASYQLTLGAIGDAISGVRVTSSSYVVHGGWVATLRPPGEVEELVFTDPVLLEWQPEESAGTYDVYRDDLAQLPALGYGTCWRDGLVETSVQDGSQPNPGAGYFYLVTVRNRLREHGTKGADSGDNERANDAPCP